MLAQSAIGAGIVQIALKIAHAVGQKAPGVLVQAVGVGRAALGDEGIHHFGQALTPLLRGRVREIEADELEAVGKPLGTREVIERRRDQSLGQVAGGAEDHHRAGRRRDHVVILRRPAGRRQRVLVAQHPLSLPSLAAAARSPGCRCHFRPSSSLATATTRSGSKPNLRCNSFSGAEAPKVCMPMTRPAAPT